jgi:hypothetical protein
LDEPPNYLGAFVLNSLFAVDWKDPIGRLILMFGRRVEHAIREYRSARELLAGFVERLPQTNEHFLRAMRAATHFEQCIGAVCQASGLLDRIAVLLPPDQPFPPDDRRRRLRLIWNRAKHFDEDLADKETPSAELTAPVWLTNTGIESTKASVSYAELHSALAALLSVLKLLSEDLPRQAVERQRAKSERDAEGPS